MKVKVCGLKYLDNILKISELKVDFIGFIFYEKSPRYLDDSLSFDEIRKIPSTVQKVGVFVNESVYSILNKVAQYDLEFVQLHGSESEEVCAQLKPFVKIIKVFSVTEHFDFDRLLKYEKHVNYFLFDSPSIDHGGSGKQFSWQALKNYRSSVPYFLSGGISEECLTELMGIDIPAPYALDINSKFETEPGLKDEIKIDSFIKKIKNYENTSRLSSK